MKIRDCASDLKNDSPYAPHVVIPDTVASLFNFPCADDLQAAADAFPDAFSAITQRGWRKSSVPAADGSVEWHEWRPINQGIYAKLDIAPGVVKFRRVNDAAHDRAMSRRKDDAARLRAEVRLWERPLRESQQLLLDYLESEEHALRLDAARGVITRWSSKSRNGLRLAISQLDLAHELLTGAPALVTLTLPGSWLAVAPTAGDAAAAFHRFDVWWARAFGAGMRCIWKREFQSRGAPHWHLWTVLPERPADFDGDVLAWRMTLRRKIAEGWTTALNIPSPLRYDYEQSLLHGVDVSYTEGARSRDPRRLATYFLKESAAASKDYQNHAPKQWAGQSVGRFWGVRGFDRAIVTVDLNPATAHRVWRVMKRLRESRRFSDQPRRKVNGRAGFVLVNDGAAFATKLASFVASYTGSDGGGESRLYFLESGSFRISNLPSSSSAAQANFAAYRARAIATLEIAELERMFDFEQLPAALAGRKFVLPPPYLE